MTIISRADWGATGRIGHATSGAKHHLFVHHSVEPRVPASATQDEEYRAMRNVASAHDRNPRIGLAPGYSFVIMQSGRVYEGQGWGRIGAHTGGRNSRGYGVCFFVDGRYDVLTDEAVAAFDQLAQRGVELGHLHPQHSRTPHSAVLPTECPGENVIRQIVEGRPIPTGPDAAAPMPTLRRGKGGSRAPVAEREAVRQLQRLLQMADEHRTGFFGPITESTVRDFQQENDLKADGIVGPQTWGALFAAEERRRDLADRAGAMGPAPVRGPAPA